MNHISKASVPALFHSFDRLEPLFSSVRNFGFTALKLKFQADETLVPSRRNKSFKREKLKSSV